MTLTAEERNEGMRQIFRKAGYKHVATFATRSRALKAARKSGRTKGAKGTFGGHFAYSITPKGKFTLWEYKP